MKHTITELFFLLLFGVTLGIIGVFYMNTLIMFASLWILGYMTGAESKKNLNPCLHEWHADQDNYCNTCIKCGARQEIYTE